LNKLKTIGVGFVTVGGLTNDQLLLILSIVITVLGMIQDYLRDRKKEGR
jgi:hypothetical protein